MRAKEFLNKLREGWESGPPEYKEPYDDADDAYDRRRQEKLDIEAEKENAKRPQKKIYTLLGRGPNMEPNYKFPGEYASQEDAIAARAKLMADPNTPHPEYIGIHSYTKYLDESSIEEEKDACYHKVKSRYKVWPSAYASGALSKCRKVGAKNWGNKNKK